MPFFKKKAVIFDLDGTLADTIGAITEAINLTMEHFLYPTKTEAQVQNAIGNGAKMLIKRLIPSEEAEDEEKVSRALKYYDAMYAETYMHTDKMYVGVKETVDKLCRMGLKLAVFSNKQDAYVKGLTEKFFPQGEISVSRGQTDIPVKPDPQGVRLILDELSLEPCECVFVGDSGVDIKTAENSGMDFIGVAWGFCGREKLKELGAKVVIDSPDELVEKTIQI